MKTVEEVIEKIRVEAGLKRLEFGCEVKITLGSYSEKCHVTSLFSDGSGFLTNGNYSNITSSDFTGHSYEIIGLPVQLNDLIFTIKKVGGEEKDRKGILESATSASILAVLNRYEWTKSVRQNLTDNKELLELVISLIF